MWIEIIDCCLGSIEYLFERNGYELGVTFAVGIPTTDPFAGMLFAIKAKMKTPIEIYVVDRVTSVFYVTEEGFQLSIGFDAYSVWFV